MNIIEFKDVSFKYSDSDNYAIRHINLKIKEGEFVLISGPTGCGKTTLTRCINGLIPHFHQGELEGEVYVNNLLTTEHTVASLSSIVGMVFQNPENQLVSLNVKRELAFGPENLGIPREEIERRIQTIMEKFKITHLAEKAPYEMSGGEQQQVAIASVLTLNPKIIVLDEPTANLDPQSAKEIIQLIGSLNKQMKMTVIIIEHRLDMITEYVSRVLLMKDGVIVSDGPPEDVLYSDKAEEIGVSIPRVIKVFKFLKQMGLEFNRNPICIQDAKNLLLERMRI
ncbi:MAG: energy-coupling factor ABC transporter ATP-binding protein [Candidatus Odinarchaeia archaeon]